MLLLDRRPLVADGIYYAFDLVYYALDTAAVLQGPFPNFIQII